MADQIKCRDCRFWKNECSAPLPIWAWSVICRSSISLKLEENRPKSEWMGDLTVNCDCFEKK